MFLVDIKEKRQEVARELRERAKRHKPNERQKDYALVAIYMSLNAGFMGVVSVLYYIFSTVFSG